MMEIPTFKSEADLERYVRRVIADRISAKNSKIYALVSKKAVDIIVCKDNPVPELFFLEVKYFKANHGRLGFGSGGGRGFQPEILKLEPAYFERNMRWVIASEAHQPDKLLMLTSSEVRKFVSGGNIGPKFNNFQSRLWREGRWYTHEEFALELEMWMQ